MKLQRPKSWETAKLGELALFVLGGDWGEASTFDSPEYEEALCIRGSEFRNWDIDKGSTAVFRKIKKSSLSRRTLKEGDILIEISGGGPEQPVGRTVVMDRAALMQAQDKPKICTNFVRLLRAVVNVDSKYINYYLVFFYKSGKILDYQAGSNNLRNLKFKDYLNIELPIPPLAEQHRIVAKIEELFSELDKGVENLKLAQEQLKIYRQTMLRDAFVGKLTTQWRINNGEPLESAGALLEQIQFQREKNYRHQISSWEALGKKGAKPKPPKLLLALSPEEFGNLPKLASGWTWVKLGDIADLRGGITKGKNLDGKVSTKLPYLRVANVQDGYLNLNLIKQIAVFVDEENKYKLQKGDVLYTEGGDKDKLGRGAVWNCEIDDCIHQNHIFRARIFSNLYVPDLLAAYSRTQEAKNYFFKHAKQTTNLASINLGVLTNLPIPMCCANEQKEVLNILNSTFAVAENIEKDLNDSIKRSELLRQSILQKAFSGQLVPQDLNDEPASELLSRIKAEVAKSKPIKKNKAP